MVFVQTSFSCLISLSSKVLFFSYRVGLVYSVASMALPFFVVLGPDIPATVYFPSFMNPFFPPST